VEGEAAAGGEVAVDAHGFGGVAMLGAHEPAGGVGADGDEGEVGCAAAVADDVEQLRVVGGVAHKVGGAAAGVDEVAAPEALVAAAA